MLPYDRECKHTPAGVASAYVSPDRESGILYLLTSGGTALSFARNSMRMGSTVGCTSGYSCRAISDTSCGSVAHRSGCPLSVSALNKNAGVYARMRCYQGYMHACTATRV